MTIGQADGAALDELQDVLHGNSREGAQAASRLSDFYSMLVDADASLKAIIPYFIAPHVRPDLNSTGDPEYGLVPYWARHPKSIPGYEGIPEIVLEMIGLLDRYGLIPQPTITPQEYDILLKASKAGTAIGPSGASWSPGAYHQLDYNWLRSPVNALLTRYSFGKADFGQNWPAILPLPDGKLRFALAGDWGTGVADAIAVCDAITRMAPDYLIHLGDVYYNGTPQWSSRRPYWGYAEESEHLVKFWPKGLASGRSFTLNSNHEMYAGGYGLFEDALPSPAFRHQNGKSYFLLHNDDWQIFGLDTAYDSPDFLCMYGALNQEQMDFVRSKHDSAKRVILLTHHTPYDVTGRTKQVSGGISLLDQVRSVFSGLPDYWYFGHIHDGVVYDPKEGCRMRCAGHAAMPYGAPWVLAKTGSRPPFTSADYIDGIEFFAGTPKDPARPEGQVKNGFACFTLDKNQITELFYDSDGRCTWSG